MRRAWGLFCWLLIGMFCQELVAQSNMIRYETFRNTPLAEAFQRLEKTSGLTFNYAEEQVRNKRVTLTIKDRPLQEAVDVLLHDTELEAVLYLDRKVVVIRSRTQTSSESSTILYLTGRVTDWETEGGLVAGIRHAASQKGVWANALGYFNLPIVQTGDTIELEVRHLGYQSQKIIIPPGTPARPLNVRMKPVPVEIGGVMIERAQEANVDVKSTMMEVELRPQKFGSVSGFGENDPMRTVQVLPGVSSTKESASELYVRGGTPAHNLLLFDGMTMYQPGHFFGMVGSFNSDAIEDITLQRGGFGARYGGRLSSVIEIQTRPQKPDSIRLGVGINALNGKALLEVPFWKSRNGYKAAFMIAARRSTTDLIQSWLYRSIFNQVFQRGLIANNQTYLKGDDFLQAFSSPRFAFGDLNTKLIFEPSKKDHISFSTFGGFDQLTYTSTLQKKGSEAVFQDQNQLKLGNIGFSGQWQRKWSRDFHTETEVAYSTFVQGNAYQSDVVLPDDMGNTVDITLENRIRDMAIRQHGTWTTDSVHFLEGGWQLNRLRTQNRTDSYSYRSSGSALDTLSLRNTLLADSADLYHTYLQYSYQPNTPFSMQAGVRHTYYSKTARHYFAPRVSIKFALTDNWALKAAFGQYRQFINRIEVPNQLKVGEDFWALADGDSIPVASSQHLIAGISYRTPDMLIDIEAYHKELTDLTIYTQEFFPTIGELQNGYLINEGTGKAIGLDFLFKKTYSIPGGTFTGIMSYSLSQVMYSFPGIENARLFYADHDQRHTAKWVNMLNLGRWNFNSTWTFSSGLPYTPAIGIQSRAHSPLASPRIQFGERNTERLPMYHRLDLSAAYKFTFLSDRRHGNIGISIFNVYNRQNVKSRYYVGMVFPDEEEIEPSLVPVDRLLMGFTPNLFLNLNF